MENDILKIEDVYKRQARDWAYTYKDYSSLQAFLQSYIKENKI